MLGSLAILIGRGAPLALLALAAAGAILTFGGLSNLRYLYPALPLFSIGIAWLISEMPPLTGPVVALIALNLWFLPASNWYHGDFALFRKKQMETYVTISGPQRILVEYLNRKAPGEPVAFFGGAAIAGLHARAYTDTWHTYAYWSRLIGATTPDEIAAMFGELGIHHLITPHPLQTEYPVTRLFVDRWTEPTSIACGSFVLREFEGFSMYAARVVDMGDPDADRRIVRDIMPRTDVNWRWTGRRPALKIKVRVDKSLRYTIDFTLPDIAFKDTGPVTIAFTVNDRLLDRVRYTEPGYQHFEKEVPPDWLPIDTDAIVGAEIDKMWIHRDDGKAYGFIITRMGLTR